MVSKIFYWHKFENHNLLSWAVIHKRGFLWKLLTDVTCSAIGFCSSSNNIDWLLNLMTVNWNCKTLRMRMSSVFEGYWGKWRAEGGWKYRWNRRLGRFRFSLCTPKCHNEVSNYTRQKGNWSWHFPHLLLTSWAGRWEKGSFCFVVCIVVHEMSDIAFQMYFKVHLVYFFSSVM